MRFLLAAASRDGTPVGRNCITLPDNVPPQDGFQTNRLTCLRGVLIDKGRCQRKCQRGKDLMVVSV